jgi:hypothetical protein
MPAGDRLRLARPILTMLSFRTDWPVGGGGTMRRVGLFFAWALMALPLAPVLAQEGHPLKGSWIGVWESNEDLGEFVLVVLDWDGDEITGIINPGTDDIEIETATLNPDDWSVAIEADAQTKAGPRHYVIEGTIQDLELPSRSIVGTWRDDASGGGHFEIARQ